MTRLQSVPQASGAKLRATGSRPKAPGFTPQTSVRAGSLKATPRQKQKLWLVPFVSGLAATVIASYLIMNVLGLRFAQPVTCPDMRKLRFFQTEVRDPAVVFVGNSQMHYGVMPPVVAGVDSTLNGFNLALPGSPLDVNLILARDLLVSRQTPGVLVLGVMPLELEAGGRSEPELLNRYGSLGDIASGVKRGELPITDLAAASFRGVENLLQAPFGRLKKPIHAYRVDHLRQGLGGWWTPADVAGAPVVPPDIWQTMLSKLPEARAFQFHDDSKPARRLRGFRDLAEERGIRLVLVQPPQHPDYCRRLYAQGTEDRCRSWLDGFCTRERLVYWDLNQLGLYEHADFADPVHLNARGAARFSARLAQKLADLPRHPRTPNQVQ